MKDSEIEISLLSWGFIETSEITQCVFYTSLFMNDFADIISFCLETYVPPTCITEIYK
jgi:hypothetical protein